MTQSLVIENLVKRYSNGVEAVRDISLTVNQGDFFALLGPNGAGKSTTIGIVSSLVTKTSGKVSVYGYDLDTDFVSAKKQIGLVPQEFNFNVFEPIREVLINQAGYYGIPRRLASERAEYYLKKLELWDKRTSGARLLSGGMKRRLMIARALVHEPKLLILDEPTAGVDIEIRYTMWDFFKELNQNGTTIILTTHYLEEAESLCRNIAIIDKGQIIQNTSIKQLINQLDRETFVLDLKQPLTSDMVIEGYSMERLDDHTLELEVAKADGINVVFDRLSQKGIEVLSMRNKSNRLEQLFLKLVKGNRESINSDGEGGA